MKTSERCALVACLLLFAPAAFAETVVLTRGRPSEAPAGYRVVDVSGRGSLEAYSLSSGVRAGAFPALVDEDARIWVQIVDGDLAAAETALAARLSAAREGAERMLRAAKSPDQVALEAEYFEAADALHVLAGEAAPTNDEPASLSAVKAKVEKAKGSKGGSKKADDYLEIQASHVDLLTLDLELRAYDPGWRSKAKRPKE